MGIWSSIRNFCHKWKPEIQLYGIGLLLLVSALARGRMAAAIIVLAGVVIMDAMRRWGEPWRQLGEKEFERRRLAQKERWHELTADLVGRLRKEDPPPLPTEVTNLVPRPSTEDDLPESPAPIVESEKPAAPIIPPVTHDT